MKVEDRDGGLRRVTIERPEALNALNDATIAEIDRCFESLAADASVRAVVVTGSGPKSFVAGADIKELSGQSAVEGRARSRRGQRAFDRVERAGKPVIAAINGFALGGGCELALHADIIIAGEGAKLGQPEVKIGIMPGGSGTQRLFRAIGKYKGMLMVLTGELFSARECCEMGLVSRVVPDAEVVPHAIQLASSLARLPPIALEMTKEAALRGQD
ncbi:MAG: enoyl-CoA hydratase/isomerase family protein, partial [Planctomycetes bacterium]|nr:enoyl-CoA hydratase/isomerase family protein [Planctomycetota bacterium]